MKKNIWVLFLLLLTNTVIAQDNLTVVAIGQATLQKTEVAVVASKRSFTNSENIKKANEILAIIKNDLSFYKKKFSVKATEVSQATDASDWKSKSVDFLIVLEMTSAQPFTVKAITYSVKENRSLSEKVSSNSNLRRAAHELADSSFQSITGDPSIFNSKILFVSDRDSRRGDAIKELYLMDFDGGNKTQLTRHRGMVISPDISFDGKKVVYSLIKEGRSSKRNIDLYLMDLDTKESKRISSRPGINSGAIFMPDGVNIALTLSHEGNAEIYLMDMNTQKLKRITNHYSPDVDPSFNKAGDKMVFLSGRSGMPMIYMMDPRSQEKDVRRISYVGEFNATPRFSPDGKEIAFSSWLDNRFDIFRLDSDGNNLVRLTKDFGSNEDPTYSNDNEFIAFSSQRVLSRTKAVHNIYIMDREGDIFGSITENYGNCITPRWSK